MQVGKISSCDINVNSIKSSCVCKPCNYNLKSKQINDTFVSSKSQSASFGSLGGKLIGSGLGLGGGMILGSFALLATGGLAAPLLITAATAAAGGAVGNAVTGPDKD